MLTPMELNDNSHCSLRIYTVSGVAPVPTSLMGEVLWGTGTEAQEYGVWKERGGELILPVLKGRVRD